MKQISGSFSSAGGRRTNDKSGLHSRTLDETNLFSRIIRRDFQMNLPDSSFKTAKLIILVYCLMLLPIRMHKRLIHLRQSTFILVLLAINAVTSTAFVGAHQASSWLQRCVGAVRPANRTSCVHLSKILFSSGVRHSISPLCHCYD